MTQLLAAFLFLIASVGLTSAYAQTALPSQAAPPLFKVSDEDTEIFLFGTFHVLPQGVDWRSPEVGNVIDRAETVWFEVETDSPKFASTAQAIVAEKGSNPEGVTLTSLLGSVRGTELAAILKDLEIPIDALDPMRPWQAFLALSSQLIISEGYNPTAGVDAQILREARLRGRNIQFLETAEEQLSLFTELDPQTELSMLQLTIRDWSVQKEQLSSLLAAWQSGDIERIDRLMNDELRATLPAAYDALITSRNKNWAEKIIPMTDTPGVVLVAVGAGHLAGKNSVPEILTGAGFKVERVLPNTTNLPAPQTSGAPTSLPSDALEKLFPNQPTENKSRPETDIDKINEIDVNPAEEIPALSDDEMTEDFIEQLIRTSE